MNVKRWGYIYFVIFIVYIFIVDISRSCVILLYHNVSSGFINLSSFIKRVWQCQKHFFFFFCLYILSSGKFFTKEKSQNICHFFLTLRVGFIKQSNIILNILLKNMLYIKYTLFTMETYRVWKHLLYTNEFLMCKLDLLTCLICCWLYHTPSNYFCSYIFQSNRIHYIVAYRIIRPIFQLYD